MINDTIIRPRRTYCIAQATCWYRLEFRVCLSVRPLVTNVNSGEMAELIEMPFGVMGRVDHVVNRH